jgi:hypothetical protein
MKKQNRRWRNDNQVALVRHPPPIQPQIFFNTRLRFVAGANGTAIDATFDNLLNAICVATSALNLFELFDQVKLNAVEIWSCGAGAGGATTNVFNTQTITLSFSGDVIGQSGSGKIVSDTSMGIEPLHIFARPGRNSQCSQWQPSSSGAAFSIRGQMNGAASGVVPPGTVVDLDLSFRNDGTRPTAGAAGVGLAPGELYYRGLDGLPVATTQWAAQAPLTA